MKAPASRSTPDGVEEIRGHSGGDPRFPEDAARAVRLAVFDVDGVLTDASVYLGRDSAGNPIELKRFDIQDGLALKLLGEAGVRVALVSGRVSDATTLRARELGIEECHQDAGAQKLPVVRDMLDRFGLDWSQVAMVADDLPDLSVFRKVGFPVAVQNAVPEIRREAAWVTRRSGGRGAVREFVSTLLEARGQWEEVVEAYVAARSDGADDDRRGTG